MSFRKILLGVVHVAIAAGGSAAVIMFPAAAPFVVPLVVSAAGLTSSPLSPDPQPKKPAS